MSAAGGFFADQFFGIADFKFIQLVAALKGCNEPSRLFSLTGPCFRWSLRIAVFGQNLWILAARRAISRG